VENIRSIIIFVSVVLGIWAASALGLFRLLDQTVYDEFVDVTPELSTASAKILLIEVDDNRKTTGNDVWLRRLKELQPMNPRQILFLFIPEKASKDFFVQAHQSENVVFGREVTLKHPVTNEPVMEMVPAGLTEDTVHWGVVTRPPSYHGLHRYYYASVTIEDEQIPTLESLAAGLSQELAQRIPDPFLVNFNGRFNGLPKISLDRVCAGELVPTLVRGRTVMIGFNTPYQHSGLYTPVSDDDPLTLLDFHGHVLDTLMARKIISELSLMEKALWVCRGGIAGAAHSPVFNLPSVFCKPDCPDRFVSMHYLGVSQLFSHLAADCRNYYGPCAHRAPGVQEHNRAAGGNR